MADVPDWDDYEKDEVLDNKFNFEFLSKPFRHFSHIPFPGYIANNKFPFTYNNSLTHGSNKFSSSDGPREFSENLKKAPADWKYRTKDVEYIVNSDGFRTKEWDQINWSEAIVLFGCSCTFGVGLAEDETISHHLSRLTGREVVNLGVSSGSNELILNNCSAMIKNFPMPYGVVLNWTTTDRFRFYSTNKFFDLGPWSWNSENSTYIDLNKHWEMTFADPGNELAKNYYWSTYADAMFAGRTKYSKVSYFGLTAHHTRSDAFFEIDNGARDMIHPGEGNSIQVAEFVAKQFAQ